MWSLPNWTCFIISQGAQSSLLMVTSILFDTSYNHVLQISQRSRTWYHSKDVIGQPCPSLYVRHWNQSFHLRKAGESRLYFTNLACYHYLELHILQLRRCLNTLRCLLRWFWLDSFWCRCMGVWINSEWSTSIRCTVLYGVSPNYLRSGMFTPERRI